MAIINGVAKSADEGFYPTEIEQSLRFNDDDSAALTWIPSSEGNRKTWTFSAWVKLGEVSAFNPIFTAYTDTSNYTWIAFQSDGQFRFDFVEGGAEAIRVDFAPVYRDSSAWYHIVFVYDSTDAVSTNRIKLYVNGERVTQTGGLSNFPSLNENSDVNSSVNTHGIGRNHNGYFDGYLADVHFTDGTAYDATAFGEFKNGVWVAKTPSVTYGTNGFYLDFADGGAIGNDVSGNNNDWTPTNLASTDVMLDSPTNNFATLNPIAPSVGSVGSEGNLRSSLPSSNVPHFATQAIPASGKWYFEVRLNSAAVMSDYNQAFGIRSLDSTTYFHAGIKSSDITLYSTVNGTNYGGVSSGSAGAVGDIYGMAIDRDANTIVIYRNGTAIYSGNNMAQHLGEENQVLLPYLWRYTSYSANESINFGQDSSFAGLVTAQGYTDANGRGDFYYAPPAGYLALCTANLPEPAIGPNSATLSDENFNTVLYTSNGSTQSITGMNFQPDFLWTKNRSSTWWHQLNDVIRGANYSVYSNDTQAEAIAADYVTSFDSDGFSVDYSSASPTGNAFVGWGWKANGSGVSNTDGSITSTVSANVDAGFSIITWTGTGANGTIGHGLNSAPDLMIVKDRSNAYNWYVYHNTTGSNLRLEGLNTTSAATTQTDPNQFVPTSSVIAIPTYASQNTSGANMLCYAFHSVEGYSKVFSYTGNGSTDGPFQNLGFRPAWMLLKRTNAASDWILWDAKRDAYNVMDSKLSPNTSGAEYTGSAVYIDALSNGFKLRNTDGSSNSNGDSYIGIAFAEMPAKYSLSR